MKRDIHWWEIPLDKFSIKLEERIKGHIFNLIINERLKSFCFRDFINEKSRKYGFDWDNRRQRALLWYYKKTAQFIPAWFLYECSIYFNLDLEYIEKNIVAYISRKGKHVISNPKLPIEVNPGFIALFVHALCDGSYNQTLQYYQKKKIHRKRYMIIAKNVFGDWNVDYKSTCYLPTIISEIILNYFGVSSVKCRDARIPYVLFRQPRLNKVSVVSSFLLDDGYCKCKPAFYSINISFLADFTFFS